MSNSCAIEGVDCGDVLTVYITAYDNECASPRTLQPVAETGEKAICFLFLSDNAASSVSLTQTKNVLYYKKTMFKSQTLHSKFVLQRLVYFVHNAFELCLLVHLSVALASSEINTVEKSLTLTLI